MLSFIKAPIISNEKKVSIFLLIVYVSRLSTMVNNMLDIIIIYLSSIYLNIAVVVFPSENSWLNIGA
jgi:hypothetical protein